MMRLLVLLVWWGLLTGIGQAQTPSPQTPLPLPNHKPDEVTFGIDWQAEAAYGGYYQAIATGIYARHGLAVTIRQGGPQVNQAQLLLAGRLDFSIASNSFLALNFAQQQLPFVVVAAMFQKDPSVLIAHQGQGNDSLVAMRGKPIMISGDSRAGWWNYLKARFGYTDSQIRPYTFNLQPFLASPAAIQQGYATSEPFAIQQASGQPPVVLLLADSGFNSYGSLIATSRKLVQTNPDLVQRFVDASIEGWYSYLFDNPAPADALIREANPDISAPLLAFGRQVLIGRGIVASGDAEQLGIGSMSAERWTNFTGLMVQQGLYPRGTSPEGAYTLQFVNRRVGLPK